MAGKPVLLALAGTQVVFDIAMLEGIAGIEATLEDMPLERLCFGSYAPVFYHALVVLGHDEYRAVVIALLTYFPRVGDADAVLVDRFGHRRGHHQDRELVGGARLPRRELGFERLALARGQGVGEIDDAPGERRYRMQAVLAGVPGRRAA